MPSPSYEERICSMFDSFCKTVSRNCVRNLKKVEINREKYFQAESIEFWSDILGKNDSYSSDSYMLYVDGHSCVVESETLYKALLSLPDKQREVLLLDFWRDLSDNEIATYLEVTNRTVYNLRQRAFKAIRGYYGRNLHPWTKL